MIPPGSRRFFRHRWLGAAGAAVLAVTASGMIRIATTLEALRTLNPHLSARSDTAWPLKLNAIMHDEYTFFRGTADLFYEWCRNNAHDWMARRELDVRLHGDVHVGNIGTFRVASTTGLDLGFGLVDLDETIRGPYPLDLLRALTSLRFVATGQEIEVSEAQFAHIAAHLCDHYRAAMVRPNGHDLHDVPFVRKALHQARAADIGEYLARYIEGDPPQFKRSRTGRKGAVKDVMLDVDENLFAEVVDAVWAYVSAGTSSATREQFGYSSRSALAAGVLDVVDWARVESSGSQGLEKYLVLLDRPLLGLDHPLILQLKEEPPPAAARAGMLQAESGTDRAEEVADAHAQISRPAQWLVGHTSMRGRGFLVKTKDPWGVELSPKDIRTASDLKKVAELMGTLLGNAHRTALDLSAPRHPAIQEIATDVAKLAPHLAKRSRAAQIYLRDHFRRLLADPKARALRERARVSISSVPTRR